MNLRKRLVAMLLCVFAVSLHAESVTITNSNGQSLEVELISYKNGQVEFRTSDGIEHTVRMQTLNKASRRVVVRWNTKNRKAKAKSKANDRSGASATEDAVDRDSDSIVDLASNHRIKAYVHTRRSSKDTDGGYQGWKDIDETIEPRVVIENQEYYNDYKNLTATLVLVGENVRNKSELKVVYKGSFKFSVEHRDEFTWKGKPFKLDYLVDDNDGHDNSYGYRYRYYFLVIENADGTVGHVRSSRSSWENDPDLIKKVKLNGIYDRKLQ